MHSVYVPRCTGAAFRLALAQLARKCCLRLFCIRRQESGVEFLFSFNIPPDQRYDFPQHYMDNHSFYALQFNLAGSVFSQCVRFAFCVLWLPLSPVSHLSDLLSICLYVESMSEPGTHPISTPSFNYASHLGCVLVSV